MSTTLPPRDAFVNRHNGPSPRDIDEMLAIVNAPSLDALIEQVIPSAIRTPQNLDLPVALDELSAIEKLRAIADQNVVARSYLGYGYHDTITPPVILRNILENPGWYTAYTPYQAEISQGRLEALLNYQTAVQDLTGLQIANASMLDEATAAAEAMTMAHRLTKGKCDRFLVDANCHPQTIAVVLTRAEPLGIDVVIDDIHALDTDQACFGALIQYPATDGSVVDLSDFCDRVHAHKGLVTAATDLLALTILKPPGEFGADIAVGNSQRFGVPLGYGGPHAAFMATSEKYKRQMPGRIIGVSRDRHGHLALRMALQTREQHIRRDRATSNICTAQVLLAICAGAYAVWHGPEGLRAIAERVHGYTKRLASAALQAGHTVLHNDFFDTLRIQVAGDRSELLARANALNINIREIGESDIIIALDERVTDKDLNDLYQILGADSRYTMSDAFQLDESLTRTSGFLSHETFHKYRSETEMLRYLHSLESKDLSLTTAMIPLGSCTMKLNATTEMIPVTWREFGGLHPFAPLDQAKGYQSLFADLETWLAEITGFDAVSLQPNAGSQGEYAGLLTIRRHHERNGNAHRNICLIPTSAHGTNPASAVMAGMKVVAVQCDDEGNINVEDLREKAQAHSENLSSLMITYPSTHGVFEESIKDICQIIHDHGGQVYMDGANLNAMVGLCRPGELGADVCHLNLHKTFCIPHGGGGPGMGPIAVAAHLAPYLPGHSVVDIGHAEALGPVSAAPWGSPSILPITWAYIAMMGEPGLTRASKIAILSANYIAERLKGHFDVLYTGSQGRIAHECILDCRGFKATTEIQAKDIAKRLMDYGFHAPTMSWPVVGTLMVEPTESEAKGELDRFCDAMIAIRNEIRDIESGQSDKEDNALLNAPHTAIEVGGDTWSHPYPRSKAAWPIQGVRDHKYWPPVGRIDDAYGDRNLICSCPPWGDEALEEA
ncbi:MAG: glycine dehydrogenase (aminomethyl-transferring) [Deltaproteobacteria bacterium]|nr:glycine dehydrogenase (aminomethyl-transferring) [Deltaproteobacteria bacterium]